MAVPRSELCSCLSDLQCRHEISLRATYFRRDLPHVVGSPNLRVICSIRLPFNHRSLAQLRASKLSQQYDLVDENQCSPVSCICRVSNIQLSSLISHWGLNGSLKFSNISLCTCHNLLTPEALHILTKTDASVLTSVDVKPLVNPQILISKLSAMPVLRSCVLPTACTILCVRFTCFVRDIFFPPPQAKHSIRVTG